MRKPLVAATTAILLAATTAIAFADCYINPKGDITLLRVSPGCHAWGSSVRCDLDGYYSGWATFTLKDNKDLRCIVSISKNGNKWDAYTHIDVPTVPDKKKISC